MYPELVEGRRCSLVVFALETGGRWSKEAAEFVEQLSYAKSRSAPLRLRAAAAQQWQRRWGKLVSVACARAFASSLVAPTSASLAECRDGGAPELAELFGRGDAS